MARSGPRDLDGLGVATLGRRLLCVASFTSVLVASPQAGANCGRNGCADLAAVESVRARMSSACKCVATEGRYPSCARRITRAALRREAQGSEASGRCSDDRAVEDVRALVSLACAGTSLGDGFRGCAKGILRGALRAGPATPPALPPPVEYRPEPERVTLGDPAFEPLPGARADFGRLGGAVYQIEVPGEWNGRLLLHMHGYEERGPQANVTPPDIRTWAILHGYAWGASSFSSTSWIAGRAADETAALWDYFTQKYGRPCWTYVTGISMGGAASQIAAERYPDRFDGSLALCGSPGFEAGAKGGADYFAAGAYLAGVTQAEFDALTNPVELVLTRILPALEDPAVHAEFENIMLDLTGGPRAFDREGFHLEESTNWFRSQLLVAGRLATNAETVYQLGPQSSVPSEAFDLAAIRQPTNTELLQSLLEGNETTGEVEIPLLSLYTTGDGQVPIDQARTLRRRVDTAGKGDLLVQRVFRDPSHCGFSTEEQERSLEALVAWVEDGVKPEGHDVLVDDLRTLDGQFELSPRAGTPEADAVPGAADRVALHGSLTLDGAPFDAPFLGAIVRRDGLITPCQGALPSVQDGGYAITVLANGEVSGCGAPGTEILLWTYAQNRTLFSFEALPWPGDGAAAVFDGSFSTSAPQGGSSPTADFIGEVFRRSGERPPHGTRIEAYVGRVLCGVASTRRTGNFGGYILSVVGPDAVEGCDLGAPLTFRVEGQRLRTAAVNAPGEPTLDLILPRRQAGQCVDTGGGPAPGAGSVP